MHSFDVRIGKIERNYSLKMQYRNWIRRLYSTHTRVLCLYRPALAPALRHLIFYKIFHSISASCANFIFPLFGNINYEIIHLCCNLHTIPTPLSLALSIVSTRIPYMYASCDSVPAASVWLLFGFCRTNTGTHTHIGSRKKMENVYD